MSSRSSRATSKTEPPRTVAERRTRKKPVAIPPSERVNVVILSRKESLYSTSRLVEAVKTLGHEPRVIDTLHCDLYLERGKPALFYRGEPLRGADVVVPRIGASITQYGLAVVNQ